MRNTHRRAGVLGLALAVGASAAGSSGCSFFFVDGPPPNAKNLRTFNCTTSNAVPGTDLGIAGLVALYGYGAAIGAAIDASSPETGSSSQSSAKETATILAAATTGVAAVFLASAYVGHERATECREATGELMMRLFPNPGPVPAPGYAPGYPPPGYPPPGYPPPGYPMAPPQPYDPWAPPPPGATRPPGPPAPWVPPPGAVPPAPPPPR
jgi:hypothetical protein